MNARVLAAFVAAMVMGTYFGCNCGGPGLPTQEQCLEDPGLPGCTEPDGSVTIGLPPVEGDGGTPVALPDGGTCFTAACSKTIYACGNCLDDDGDGLIDDKDPNCLGPCHNLENNFSLGIQAALGGSCGSADCYFDNNAGSGNDQCQGSVECDPLNPAAPRCKYADPPGGFGVNPACPSTQNQVCNDYCKAALTPNGCDCFGCCTVTSGGLTRDIFLGGEEYTKKVCNLENLSDTSACRACTKNPSCEKGCGECQLCIGKTTLPSHCNTTQQCPTGEQACGLAGQAACPAGYFCLTGCCLLSPN